MLMADFLNGLLDDTETQARLTALTHPERQLDWAGTQRAIKECRNALFHSNLHRSMTFLLLSARQDSSSAQQRLAPDEAFWFAREVTIDWIAEVLSVVLLQMRYPTIVAPTQGAAIQAARLLGVLPDNPSAWEC